MSGAMRLGDGGVEVISIGTRSAWGLGVRAEMLRSSLLLRLSTGLTTLQTPSPNAGGLLIDLPPFQCGHRSSHLMFISLCLRQSQTYTQGILRGRRDSSLTAGGICV